MSNNYTKALFPFKTDKFWEEDDGKHNGWNVLSEFFNSDKGKKLAEKLKEKYKYNKETIFPAQKDIFRAFKLTPTPFNEVKVVILGQDPYPDERADGLCFSQRQKTSKRKDSLDVLFKHLGIEDNNRQLDGWAKQGVLLLNTILTVSGDGKSVRNKAGSHKSIGWQEFTKHIINALLQDNDREVGFILMGNMAIESFEKSLPNELSRNNIPSIKLDYNKRCYKKYDLEFEGNSSKFHVVESPHPASSLWSGFIKRFGSPFEIINKQFPNIAINWKHHH